MRKLDRRHAAPSLDHDVVLECRSLSVGYGQLAVVHDVELQIKPGEIVALLGPNGAGKSTLLKGLCGLLPPLEGTVELFGQKAPAGLAARSRLGLAYVPEGRSIFPSLSTADNLMLGRGGIDAAVAIAPRLRELLPRRASLLSGGEQQFLSLARAIAARPAILLADELSLGLAPLIVRDMMVALREAADEGLAVVLVEQHVRHALMVADRVVVLRRGRVVMEDDSSSLDDAGLADVEALYLAESEGAVE